MCVCVCVCVYVCVHVFVLEGFVECVRHCNGQSLTLGLTTQQRLGAAVNFTCMQDVDASVLKAFVDGFNLEDLNSKISALQRMDQVSLTLLLLYCS